MRLLRGERLYSVFGHWRLGWHRAWVLRGGPDGQLALDLGPRATTWWPR